MTQIRNWFADLADDVVFAELESLDTASPCCPEEANQHRKFIFYISVEE
jgi:hypothetical protein